MNTAQTQTLALLETALFEASLADRGWQAAVLDRAAREQALTWKFTPARRDGKTVLDSAGKVGGTGPDHVSAWRDMGSRYEMPDHDIDGDEEDEGFVDAHGTFYTRSQALLAWRAEYHTSLKKKDIWSQRCPQGDPGDSCDLKLDLGPV